MAENVPHVSFSHRIQTDRDAPEFPIPIMSFFVIVIIVVDFVVEEIQAGLWDSLLAAFQVGRESELEGSRQRAFFLLEGNWGRMEAQACSERRWMHYQQLAEFDTFVKGDGFRISSNAG